MFWWLWKKLCTPPRPKQVILISGNSFVGYTATAEDNPTYYATGCSRRHEAIGHLVSRYQDKFGVDIKPE